MNEDEMREIVRLAVHETMVMQGMEPGDPHHMQADFQYLRKARKGSEQIATWGKRAAFTAAASGALFALWEGFKMAVTK